MRSKEESHDYRYFPEPDLVTLAVSDEWLDQIRKKLPELPDQTRERFVRDYNIPEYDAEVLTVSKELADYYEECVKSYTDGKKVSNWVMTEILRELNQRKIEIRDFEVTSGDLAGLLRAIDQGTISGKMAKEVFARMAETGKPASQIIEEKGLVQITDKKDLTLTIESVLKEYEEGVRRYHNGEKKLFGFFVGEVMKRTKGKANPKLVNQILKEKLSKGETE
jgi:aspartyl-tRNA(Asn)/glutamyl-tRNA(Gln) amidotransferase subunit B